jgi:hypothetical protein
MRTNTKGTKRGRGREEECDVGRLARSKNQCVDLCANNTNIDIKPFTYIARALSLFQILNLVMLAITLDINLRELCYDLSGFLLQQLNHPYHFMVEAILILFIIYLLFQTSYKVKPKNKEELTEAVSEK